MQSLVWPVAFGRMAGPSIYISANPDELKSARQRVAERIESFGFDPVWADPEDGGVVRHESTLRRLIGMCVGMVHVVGDEFGTEAEGMEEGGSWTQIEYQIARDRELPVWTIVAGPGVSRDRAAPEAERDAAADCGSCALWEHRNREEIRFSPVARDDAHLVALVPNPRVELTRTVAGRVQPGKRIPVGKVIRNVWRVAVCAVGVVMALIYYRSPQQRKQDRDDNWKDAVAEGRVIDRGKMEEHLVAASEWRRQTDLAAAEQGMDGAVRERLAQTARAAHAARLELIPHIISRLDGGSVLPPVAVRNIAGYLSWKDSDAALGFIRENRAAILGGVEPEAPISETRGRLAPFVREAELLAVQGDAAGARAAYRELLARDPDWPDALESCVRFLFAQTKAAQAAGNHDSAIRDAEEAAALAEKHSRQGAGDDKSGRLPADALNRLGAAFHSRNRPGDAETVVTHWSRSLEMDEALLSRFPESPVLAKEVAVSCWNLGVQRDVNHLGDPLPLWKRAFEVLIRKAGQGHSLDTEEYGLLKELAGKLGPEYSGYLRRMR